MIKGMRWGLAALVLSAGAVITPVVHADVTVTGSKWVDTLTFSGDMRLRHESFYYKQVGQRDENRQRFRFRFGGVATIQDWTAGFRLASGTGQQVSTNQTETNVGSEKQLWIDQVYVSWKPQEYIKLTGGKMPNPLWRTYASDLVFDDDLNPEGYAESVDVPSGDRLGLFANFLQMPLFENRNISDAWMLSHQIGARIRLNEDTRLTVAGSLHAFLNEKAADFVTGSSAVQQQGNARVGATGQLATSLRLLHFTGELATHLLSVPVALQGDWVRNTQDTQNIGRTGYQTGAIIGKAKDANTWEGAYFYKYAQFNSTYAEFADSDFGAGG